MKRRKKVGRPPVDRPTGRAVKVYMLPDVEARAREIGGGNVSAGVAAAVRAFLERGTGDV